MAFIPFYSSYEDLARSGAGSSPNLIRMKQVTVVGAGLVGSLWSIYLAQRGYHVEVFERRADPKKNRDRRRPVHQLSLERPRLGRVGKSGHG